MARFGGITQRRQLRRAAEQALIVAFQPTPAPVSSELVVDDQWQDPDETPPHGIAMPAEAHLETVGPRRRWYRSKPAIVLAATGLVTIAVAAVLLLSRADPDVGDSTIDSPAPSATPTPTSALPSATLIPPAPPPPPSASESPPSTASETAVPTYTEPRQTSTEQLPEIGVTRTPITRAPFSATPPPSPPPLYKPSDGNNGPRHGCCGF